VTINGRVFLKAKYTVDPAQRPRAIDYAMTDGPTRGKTQLGIYELDGDRVKFCFAAPGKERPTDFTTKEGSGRTLRTWKRAGKEPSALRRRSCEARECVYGPPERMFDPGDMPWTRGPRAAGLNGAGRPSHLGRRVGFGAVYYPTWDTEGSRAR